MQILQRLVHPSTVRASAAAVLLAALGACAPGRGPADPSPGATKRLRVVHTSDFHGRLLAQTPGWAGGRAVGGSAALAAHFDSAAARFGGPTLVLSAGDDLQGTAVSNLSHGRATVAAHAAAGYDAAAVGNHEFDWGQDTLRARVAESRFPWLAANLVEERTGRAPAWVRPWVMIERRGVRTAVIGIALPTTPEVVAAGRVDGLRFEPAAPAIDRAARRARAAGADFVVVTAHVGAVCDTPGRAPEEESSGCRGELVEVAEALRERVDLLLGGHSHERVMTRAGGVPIVVATSYSGAYSVTDLERRGDSAVVVHRSLRTTYVDEVSPDTAVARVVAAWEAGVRPISERVVATIGETMRDLENGEFPLGSLIADAHRRAAGAQASLVNNGSVRVDVPAGPATYGLLYELQPFQNQLVVLEIDGARLRAALENALDDRGVVQAHVSGLTVEYDPSAPKGSRVRSVSTEDGRVIGDADRLTLATTDFVAAGGDRFTMLAELPARNTGVVDLDAVIAHLQALPQPVRPPGGERWRAVDR